MGGSDLRTLHILITISLKVIVVIDNHLFDYHYHPFDDEKAEKECRLRNDKIAPHATLCPFEFISCSRCSTGEWTLASVSPNRDGTEQLPEKDPMSSVALRCRRKADQFVLVECVYWNCFGRSNAWALFRTINHHNRWRPNKGTYTDQGLLWQPGDAWRTSVWRSRPMTGHSSAASRGQAAFHCKTRWSWPVGWDTDALSSAKCSITERSIEHLGKSQLFFILLALMMLLPSYTVLVYCRFVLFKTIFTSKKKILRKQCFRAIQS